MAIGSSMKGHVALLVLVVVMSLSSFEASAATFNVGGRNGGWVVNPKENYTQWAQRYTFRVNDYLYFRYQRGKDSVLIVSKEDYDSCNIDKPLHRFRGGSSGSTVPLNKPGPFYFISGNHEHCKNGQKFAVNVAAAAISPSPTPTPTPHPSPSPSSQPPQHPSPAPSSPPPQHHSPAPSSPPPQPPKVSPQQPSPWSADSPKDSSPVMAPAPAPARNGASSRSFGVALGVISLVVALLF